MKPMTKYERVLEECLASAATKADIAPLHAIMDGFLRAAVAKRRAALTPPPAPPAPKRPVGRPRIHNPELPRPIGRPRNLVPHYTLLDAELLEQTLGGATEGSAFYDEPLTARTLPQLAAPLAAWCRRHSPYTPDPLAELTARMPRIEFDLPRNGRPGTIMHGIGPHTTLRARIVRSDATPQEPYGEWAISDHT